MEKNIVVRGGEGAQARSTMYAVRTFRSANGAWTAVLPAGESEQLIANGDTEAEAIDNLQAALHERG